VHEPIGADWRSVCLTAQSPTGGYRMERPPELPRSLDGMAPRLDLALDFVMTRKQLHANLDSHSQNGRIEEEP
jgi:hypothetical protein